jgi:S-adenosylmethionine:diacylglycerol 3-amino-3-carboxypropyl transferase
MAETHWQRGRLDGWHGPETLLFGRVYEDSAVEMAAFPAGGRIACIASAGDTAIDLSAQHAVTAVDINPVQLAYARRRADGAPGHAGVAERWMALGRRALRLAGWRRELLEAFVGLERPAEQMAYWRECLDTCRFRLIVDNVLRLTLLRTVYAAPLLRALPVPFGPVLRARMERCWSRHPNGTNPYARALLLGDPGPGARKAPGPIRFVCADMAEFLESSPPGSFDGFAFSNIVDGASPDYRDRLFQAASRTAAKGCRMVWRSFAEPGPGMEWDSAADDRSFLWGVVSVVTLA